MVAVVITGGASPLGQDLTQRFLGRGYDVLSIVRAQNTVKQKFKPASKLRIIEADLSLPEEIDRICEIIKKEISQVWSFIHAASASEPDTNDITKLCHTFTTNVFSGWSIAESCAKKMHNGGRIVYIGSVGHKFGGKADRVGYAASKYLLEYFPRHFREFAKENILVNTVRVGVMDGATQIKTGVTKEQLVEREALIPIKRIAKVCEIAETVMFLCSNSNTYIHGAVVPVTGGE